eukprot:Nk52_evm9s539 gene=Nk52_evmTU9s539
MKKRITTQPTTSSSPVIERSSTDSSHTLQPPNNATGAATTTESCSSSTNTVDPPAPTDSSTASRRIPAPAPPSSNNQHSSSTSATHSRIRQNRYQPRRQSTGSKKAKEKVKERGEVTLEGEINEKDQEEKDIHNNTTGDSNNINSPDMSSPLSTLSRVKRVPLPGRRHPRLYTVRDVEVLKSSMQPDQFIYTPKPPPGRKNKKGEELSIEYLEGNGNKNKTDRPYYDESDEEELVERTGSASGPARGVLRPKSDTAGRGIRPSSARRVRSARADEDGNGQYGLHESKKGSAGKERPSSAGASRTSCSPTSEGRASAAGGSNMAMTSGTTSAADYYETMTEEDYLRIVSPIKRYSQEVLDGIVNRSVEKFRKGSKEGLGDDYQQGMIPDETDDTLVFHQLPERVKADIWSSFTLNFYVPPERGNEELAEPSSLTLNFFYPPSPGSTSVTNSGVNSRPASGL